MNKLMILLPVLSSKAYFFRSANEPIPPPFSAAADLISNKQCGMLEKRRNNMALIKYSEFGGKVSTLAKACPHCGLPISSISTVSTDIDPYCITLLSWDGKYPMQARLAYWLLQDIKGNDLTDDETESRNFPSLVLTGLTKKNADRISIRLVELGYENMIENDRSSSEYSKYNANADIYFNDYDGSIICPRCKSHQVTTGSRGYSLITGFIGSNKTVNRCGRCGYTWKP